MQLCCRIEVNERQSLFRVIAAPQHTAHNPKRRACCSAKASRTTRCPPHIARGDRYLEVLEGILPGGICRRNLPAFSRIPFVVRQLEAG